MKRTLILFVLTACLLGGQALAAELPRDLIDAAPEAAALLSDDPADGFGFTSGVRILLEGALDDLKGYLFSGIRAVGAIMAGVVLLGAVESAAPAGKDLLGRYSTAIGALWVTAMAAGELDSLMGLGGETIQSISQLSKFLLPTLAAAEAASGGITAASVRQVAAVFFSDILLTIIDKILLPAVYLYIGTAAAGAVLEGDAMDRIGELLKKGISWTLGGLLALFMTYLSISGAVAGAADAQAVKAAQSAMSAAVPVVGGILSEAAESILAGAGVLKSMAGTMGTLALLGICLLPFLRLGCQYLLYQGASVVAAAAGPPKLTKLIARLGDAFALVLAMTGASAVLLLISLLSSMRAVL